MGTQGDCGPDVHIIAFGNGEGWTAGDTANCKFEFGWRRSSLHPAGSAAELARGELHIVAARALVCVLLGFHICES